MIPVRYPTPVDPGVSLQVMEQCDVEPWRLAGGNLPSQQAALMFTANNLIHSLPSKGIRATNVSWSS